MANGLATWAAAKDTKLAKMWAADTLTNGEIGERLGVSATTVTIRRRTLGLPARRTGRSRAFTPGEDAALSALWLASELSIRKIALRLDCSTSTLYERVKALGLPLRGQGHVTRAVRDRMARSAARRFSGVADPGVALVPRCEPKWLWPVVDFLRSRDDVVVPENRGRRFYVNARVRLSPAQLVERANRIRARMGLALFAHPPAKAGA